MRAESPTKHAKGRHHPSSPSARARAWSAVGILAAALFCALPGALFGTYLGAAPNRMVCTPATGYGSGCDEGELLLTLLLFGVLFLTCAAFSAGLTKAYRSNLPSWRQWLPFTLFCVIVLAVVLVSAVAAWITTPGEYL